MRILSLIIRKLSDTTHVIEITWSRLRIRDNRLEQTALCLQALQFLR